MVPWELSSTMLSEDVYSDHEESIRYRSKRFAYYCMFATQALMAAVVQHDVYTLVDFYSAFRHSGKEHSTDKKMKDVMASFIYDDSDFFTDEEMQLFLRVTGHIQAVSAEQIE